MELVFIEVLWYGLNFLCNLIQSYQKNTIDMIEKSDCYLYDLEKQDYLITTAEKLSTGMPKRALVAWTPNGANMAPLINISGGLPHVPRHQ